MKSAISVVYGLLTVIHRQAASELLQKSPASVASLYIKFLG